MPSTTIKYFAFAHLPAHLQAVSKPIGELANVLEVVLTDGPEKSAGMRKLLEAKDCFVRAALEAPAAIPVSGMPPHQQRVIDEKTELDDRLQKLSAFFDNPIFAGLDATEKQRLIQQEAAMDVYSNVLGERIAAFV